MKNFKEIAEKCLKGELSGTFITIDGGYIESDRIKKAENGCYTFDRWHYVYNSVGCCLTGKYTWNIINFIPNMKENDKRTIQISLQQAREWYKSGNNTLKTLALSSFTEKELDPYPRSWIEYLQIHPEHQGITIKVPSSISIKLLNYSTLLLLRQEWIHIWSQEQGLEKDWEFDCNSDEIKYIIMLKSELLGGIVAEYVCNWTFPLSFPTKELAQDFLDTFKSFLEQAKGLY